MHKSVGAIIKDKEGRILMLDRKKFPFGWACPAGHIDKGEKPEEALVREVREETALIAEDYKLIFHEFISWNKCSRGVSGHDWYVYEILRWSGDLKIDETEEKSIDWKSQEEIKKLQLEEVWEYWFKKLGILK